MKNTFKLSGIAAVIAVIVLFTGCTNPADDGDTTYTVTFNLNGGSGTTPAARTVNSGSSITLPYGIGLSRSGLLFGGWNTSADGAGTNYAVGSSFTVTDNITLYAQWNVIQPTTVTFYANGGSGTAPSAQTENLGSSITLPSGSGLSRSGCTFGGWNTRADGTGTNYNAGSSYTVTGNITLYAKWNLPAIGPDNPNYTVIFDLNGGTGTVPGSRVIEPGDYLTLPNSENISRGEYATFIGWNTKADGSGASYTANSSYTPTGAFATIILYVQWDITPFSSLTELKDKLKWLQAHAESDTSYTVEVTADESIGSYTFSYSDKSNITITLRGVGANRTVRCLSSNVSTTFDTMFNVSSGVTLVLDNNITLQGGSYQGSYSRSRVSVDSGGMLRMNTGSAITGNNVRSYGDWYSHSSGGGVYVGERGTFTMTGGEISGNTLTSNGPYFNLYGGGVYVGEGGTFNMSGGTISDNTGGGGVYVDETGTFTMSGGEISGNNGCGVFMGRGTFTMTGGTITGNTASSGGGVYMNYGTFTMSGGEISGNTASDGGYGSYGGGVYVYDGTFIMNNGTISGNTASTSGGGVCVYAGTFTMNNGTISGNTASTSGGGVYVHDGTFTKTGGTIYGYSENNTLNSNVVKNSSTVLYDQGSAVYASFGRSYVKRKETTAGQGVNLSFDGSNGTFSGAWDY